MKTLCATALTVLMMSAMLIAQDAPKGDRPPPPPEGFPRRMNMPAEVLKKYDKDGDGKLSQEEREAMRKDRQAEFEANRAKQRAEFEKRFDKDGDGKLNAEEEAAMREEMNAFRRQGPGGPGGRRGPGGRGGRRGGQNGAPPPPPAN